MKRKMEIEKEMRKYRVKDIDRECNRSKRDKKVREVESKVKRERGGYREIESWEWDENGEKIWRVREVERWKERGTEK